MHSLAVLVAASMLRFLDPYTSLYQTDDDREGRALAAEPGFWKSANGQKDPLAKNPEARIMYIVFRASETNDRFESFYVRPRNGRSCTEPQRRIHTMQYFSYPGYTFAYFRERGISDYEAQADIEMDEWVHIKAEVSGAGAKFYVDDMETPALVVDEMFGGAGLRGGVGLYVDNGTEGNFKNLKVTYAD